MQFYIIVKEETLLKKARKAGRKFFGYFF